MATPEMFWMQRPVFEAMHYTGPEDLEDMRAWAATKDTTAGESYISRIEPLDGGGFQLFMKWVWDPDHEFQGQSGQPGDWLMLYYGSFQVFTQYQMDTEYEPIPAEAAPPEPEV